MTNFWAKLPSPIFVLAPMEDVTDLVFREIVSTVLPKPNVLFTEFTSSDGLCSQGFERVSTKLKFTNEQFPLVAQLWGNDPQKMFEAAKIVQDLGFSGVDINMGCPERNLVRKGYCSGLIGNYPLVSEIIDGVKKGANDIPVSVKTRLGIKSIMTEEWLGFLLEQKIQALTVHGRIAKQMSEGLANWEEIGKAVKLRDSISPETVVIGNGDIRSIGEGKEKVKDLGLDGIMIGRGIFHNPWVFSDNNIEHTPEEKIDVMLKHVELFVETWGNRKNFEIVKKFIKMYVKDFDQAAELRQRLMLCKNVAQIRQEVLEFKRQN